MEFNKYNALIDSGYMETIDFRVKGIKGDLEGKWVEGIRIKPDSVPEGKYIYETRHSDKDWFPPCAILPSGCVCRINFCGTIITDYPIGIEEETNMMFLGKITKPEEEDVK